MLNNLSPELIELIFTHLDSNSLKSCMDASTDFRDIIIHSPEIMKKMTLKLNDRNWTFKLQFIKDYGFYVRNVEIFSNSSTAIYYRLLYFMPKIVKLKLDFTNSQRLHTQRSVDLEQQDVILAELFSIMDCGNEIFEEFKLTKLEELDAFFYNIDPTSIFKDLMPCKSVKKLSIRHGGNIQHGHDSIVSFLCQQQNLQSLELRIARMDLIFSGETIDAMSCKLKCLRLAPSYYADCDYTYLNKFLLKQSDCLEELRVFAWRCEDEIADGISKLKSLKRLTTHGLLPYFRREKPENYADVNVVLDSLIYFRYYKGNRDENFADIDTSAMPNLQCLNAHFGIDHRLFEHSPDIKVNKNPLRNLKYLKEFHIESSNQGLLHFLASTNLETLVLKCEDILYDIGSWTKMAMNLPKLQTLVIVQILDEKFMKFIIENHENFIQKIRGLKSLELHYVHEDVLKLLIKNGKVINVVGTFCHSNSIFLRRGDQLERKFEKYDLRMISKEEYDEKYETIQFYFHPCGP